jgi:thioredoxin-related protein
MDAVTYSDPAMVQFAQDNLIAIRANVRSDSVLADRFGIRYTPTIIILDGEGVERDRTVGFVSPNEFIPALLLGIGKSHYENGRFKEASRALEELLSEYSQSRWAGEAANLKRAADKRAH